MMGTYERQTLAAALERRLKGYPIGTCDVSSKAKTPEMKRAA
jgi:hypothetical protein